MEQRKRKKNYFNIKFQRVCHKEWKRNGLIQFCNLFVSFVWLHFF